MSPYVQQLISSPTGGEAFPLLLAFSYRKRSGYSDVGVKASVDGTVCFEDSAVSSTAWARASCVVTVSTASFTLKLENSGPLSGDRVRQPVSIRRPLVIEPCRCLLCPCLLLIRGRWIDRLLRRERAARG